MNKSVESPALDYGSMVILLTNYFNELDIVSFICEELLRQSFKNISIVIVDNGSTDSSLLKKIVEDNSNVFMFTPDTNLGYLGGANYGLLNYLKLKNEIPLGVIISNSDLKFVENNFLEKLYSEYLHTPSSTGVIGTSIYSSATGVNQNPFSRNRITRSKLIFLKTIFSNRFIYFLYELISLVRRKIMSYSSFSPSKYEEEKVYAVHGAFLILTKEYFSKGGNLKYDSFLFGEEIFFAEQARKLNLEVVFDRRFKIIHEEHKSMSTVKNKTLVRYMYDSVSYLLNKYFSR